MRHGNPKLPSTRRRSMVLELLEPRMLLANTALITELMASNGNTRLDEDGDSSDWLEVHNPTDNSISLNGWHLTDDANDLTKWEFPDVSLAADEYLIVYASDKNRAVSGSELHTNFKLTSGGEYLALVEADGITIAHAYAPSFPEQFQDVSYGLGTSGLKTVLVQE
ncbi:MAG: lamin tail domain-containing protein, partial [Bythopirellula sp.]